MLQFVSGFWCGCIVCALLAACLHLYRRNSKGTGQKESLQDVKKEKKNAIPFMAPGARILIVDDSRLSRTVIKEFLTGTMVDISEAGNGAECIRLVKKEKFDLILLDQMMPGMSGVETFRRIQSSENKNTPVIAVSSGIHKENEKDYEALGFAGCLGKPIVASRLEQLLQKFVHREKVPLETVAVEKEPQKLEGFSYESGLKNFDGNEEGYRETLRLFAELWPERQEMLQQFLAEENMAEYAILIHAIKGDSRTLGAAFLGKLAYEQELKAKEGNVQAIRESFERVMKVGKATADYFLNEVSK